MRGCKKDEADPSHTGSDKDHHSGAEPIDQMPDDGTFNAAFKAGGTVKKGYGGAAYCEITL